MAAVDGGTACPSHDDAGTEILACGQLLPTDLAVCGDDVCWLADQGAFLVPKTGGSPRLVAAENAGDPYAIVSRRSDIYWTSVSAGRVSHYNVEAMTYETIAEQQPRAGYIAVDEAVIYWVSRVRPGADILSLRARAKQGGQVIELARRDPYGITGLAVDDSFIYWTATTTGTWHGSLWRFSKSNMGPAIPIATNFRSMEPSRIRATSSSVYWIATECIPRFDGPCHPFRCCWSKVFRYDKITGETIAVVDEPRDSILDIAVDERELYWTTEHSLKTSRVDGSLQRVAAESPGRPHGMGMDSEYVYWLNPQIFTDDIEPTGLLLRLRRF